jgi:hypothetical protein
VNQNYSNIQYEQQDPDSPDKGRDALRILETFGAPNCFQGAMPDGRGVLRYWAGVVKARRAATVTLLPTTS